MKCDCKATLEYVPETDCHGENHHKMCPKYATEKIPRLFYYEEAEDCWAPSPGDVDCIVSLDMLSEGEKREIEFKRVDMTDKEFDELPEV